MVGAKESPSGQNRVEHGRFGPKRCGAVAFASLHRSRYNLVGKDNMLSMPLSLTHPLRLVRSSTSNSHHPCSCAVAPPRPRQARQHALSPCSSMLVSRLSAAPPLTLCDRAPPSAAPVARAPLSAKETAKRDSSAKKYRPTTH